MKFNQIKSWQIKWKIQTMAAYLLCVWIYSVKYFLKVFFYLKYIKIFLKFLTY